MALFVYFCVFPSLFVMNLNPFKELQKYLRIRTKCMVGVFSCDLIRSFYTKPSLYR